MYTDQEILEVITILMSGKGEEEQIQFWSENQLKGIDEEVYDLIFYSKEKLTPEEVLKRAREMNKPILL